MLLISGIYVKVYETNMLFPVCVCIQIAISVLRVLLFIARPRTYVLGNIPNSVIYRNVEHYPNATTEVNTYQKTLLLCIGSQDGLMKGKKESKL